DRTKNMIAYFSLMIKKNDQYLLELLRICAKSKDPVVLSQIAQSLAKIAPDYPVECLAIIKSWTTKDMRYKIGLDSLLQQIGNGDTRKAREFFVKWIRKEKDVLVLMFDLPRYTSAIYGEH